MTDTTALPQSQWAAALPFSPRLGLVVLALAGLAAGGVAAMAGSADASRVIWSGATLPILLVLLVEIVTSLRKGSVGLDLVAALSMSVALMFGEVLAANVVGLMYADGQLLEQFAEGRAKRELTALRGRVPRTAMRKRDGTLEEVPIGELVPGDLILLRAGDTLPVDGKVVGTTAIVDESAHLQASAVHRSRLAHRPAGRLRASARQAAAAPRAHSEGLRMKTLPAAMAGANIQSGIMAGKLNGVMAHRIHVDPRPHSLGELALQQVRCADDELGDLKPALQIAR